MRPRVDGLTIVALAVILFWVFNIFRDAGWFEPVPAAKAETAATSVVPLSSPGNAEPAPASGGAGAQTMKALELDPDVVLAPYKSYVLTQGPHGFSYGHMAIDITGGKKAVILSPINGVVSELYTDEWGNPTLVIENEHYRVMMLHGIYKVEVGQTVKAGQAVGRESNICNTYDALGQSCRGRDCGYHTHLNIFDKQLGVNVNPLDLIGN